MSLFLHTGYVRIRTFTDDSNKLESNVFKCYIFMISEENVSADCSAKVEGVAMWLLGGF